MALAAIAFGIFSGGLGFLVAAAIAYEFVHTMEVITALAESDITDEKFAQEADARIAVLGISAFSAFLGPLFHAVGFEGLALETWMTLMITAIGATW